MTQAEALRTTIALLSAQLAALEGKPTTTYMGQLLAAADEAEKVRLKEIADAQKPHDFVDLAPGTGGYAGDNDPPDDELFRTHGPFMEAAKSLGWKDSTGQRFTVQTVKKRANALVGFGAPAWAYVRGEVRRLQLTPEGYAWCHDQRNIDAGIVPRGLA
jgi:hypothetical protein